MPLPEAIVPAVITPFFVKLIVLFAKFSDVATMFPVVMLLETILFAITFPLVTEPDTMLPAIMFPPVIDFETKLLTLMFAEVI